MRARTAIAWAAIAVMLAVITTAALPSCQSAPTATTTTTTTVATTTATENAQQPATETDIVLVAPSQTSLLPADGSTDVVVEPTLAWAAVAGATGYEIRLAEDSGADDPFAAIDYGASTATDKHAVTILLKYGTTYHWRLRAINADGSGPWVTSSFTTGDEFAAAAEPPPAEPVVYLPPAVLSPRDGATDVAIRPELSWSGVDDATGYQFEISEETGAEDPFTVIEQSASTTASTLTPGEDLGHLTTYNWRVRALFATGESPWVSSYFTTMSDLEAPAADSLAPAAASTLVDIELTFRWQAVPYVAGYEFEIAEEAGADYPFDLIVYRARTAINSHVARPSLKYDTTYHWRVRALFVAGQSPWVSSFLTTEPDLSALSRNSFVPAHTATDAPLQPTFSWDAVAGATGYQFDISEDTGQDDPFATIEYSASLTTNSHVITDQPEFLEFRYATSYHWRVRAVNDVSGRGPWVTSYFTIEPDPVPLGIPVTKVPDFGETGVAVRPTFGWASVDRATGYEIELSRETIQASPFAVVDYSARMVSNFHLIAVNLDYDTSYNWRVRAVSASGPGPWSSSYFITEADPTP